jgi:hypothetical protein
MSVYNLKEEKKRKQRENLKAEFEQQLYYVNHTNITVKLSQIPDMCANSTKRRTLTPVWHDTVDCVYR